MVPTADSGASATEHDFHGNKHPYHLVDPSPWPFIGSISAFVMAIGAVLYMHGEVSWLLILGTVAVMGTMAGWFWEVIKEAEFGGYHNPVVQVGMRYG
ncbi:MAG: cytochrome c oxidase subunit 3, partial [Pseudomonadota bacterium]|nr:cytochrome c oxidase subunit 3 [Pseudomonadota bacterium]